MNWSYGLIVPNIPGVTDGGCDFYKPSQNLVNAYRTDANGHPYIGTFNTKDYDKTTDYADPRLFLTVGIPGLPYESILSSSWIKVQLGVEVMVCMAIT